MKTIIYYFSGTGNSLKIAKDLCEELEECQLAPIAKVFQQEQIVARSEKVGFICPLYFWGLPDIVVEFLKKIKFNNTNYIFAIVTRGHPGARSALSQINNLINKKSQTLNSGFYITMPGNFIINYKVIPDKKQRLLFNRARNKIIRISQIISSNEIRIEREQYDVAATIRNRNFRRRVHDCDNNFSINDNCDSCGICEKVCPVNNIIMDKGNPRWQHRCQLCLACIHFCPQEAIQYGQETINRRRYHHPEITFEDIF